MAEQTPDSIITTQRNGQTIVAELFFNHSSTETFRDKLLKLALADSSRLTASDGQEPGKTPEKCPYCVTGAQKGACMKKRQKHIQTPCYAPFQKCDIIFLKNFWI